MLRNKELGRFAACFVLLAVVAAATGFALDWRAGVLAIVMAVAFGVLFWVFTRARYRRIAQLATKVDQVLHQEEPLYLGGMEEGELAILQSEIGKMTLRIREQNAALRQEKQRLADSLADIAHQLRTPLTAATLTLSLLGQEQTAGERRALLRETEALFVQMDWLLTALLKLSRLDAGIVTFQRQPLAVEPLIQEALRPLAISMELHSVTVRTQIPTQAVIIGDRGWLCEALQNILKNCLEMLADGGQIEIICTDMLLFTELAIHDTGPGFAEAELPHLFDRFYRGQHDRKTGYGIGLALCRTIITGLGGSIQAKNHRQGGALFLIRFPK